MDKKVPLLAMDYAFKLNAINKLLLYDPFFKDELNDARIDDTINIFEEELKEFKELNYTKEEIRDIVKRGLSCGYLAFERVTNIGKLIQLYELNPLNLIPGYRHLDGKARKFWSDDVTGIHYIDIQVLYLNFSFYFDFLSNKYDMLESMGKRPDILMHLRKIEREHKINQIVNDTI